MTALYFSCQKYMLVSIWIYPDFGLTERISHILITADESVSLSFSLHPGLHFVHIIILSIIK